MTTTTNHTLTALCLWEAMLEQKDNVASLGARWHQIGTCEMRQVAIDRAAQFDQLWDTLSLGEDRLDGMTFDWEFVPFLTDWVNWREGGWTVPDSVLASMVYAEHARLMGAL